MFDYQEECQILIRTLSTEDYEEARMRCAVLLEKISQQDLVSIDYIKHILFYLYDQLYAYSTSRHMRSVKSSHPSPEHSIRDHSRSQYGVSDLALCDLDHFSNACAQIEALLEQIIHQQTLLESGPESANTLIQDAQDFIRTHYTNENLSLPVIAEHLCVNPSYLSRLFSSTLSMSVSDYIARLRIRYAKTLLGSDSSVTVEQAASASGFFTVQTFIRTFRKYEHMTPGSYQKKKTRSRSES